MASIRSQRTAETTYEMQTLYGLKAVDNPMLSIGFNPFMLGYTIGSASYDSAWACQVHAETVYAIIDQQNERRGSCSCVNPSMLLLEHRIFLVIALLPLNHFAVQQHLRYTCACDGDDNIHAFQNPHMYHVVLNTIGLSCAIIEDLHRHDSSTTIELFDCMEDSLVAVFKGVIVADGGLVHAGDFVELLCSETKYALFLTFCQLETGESFCVLQGCDEFVVNSEPVLNEYECPLLAKSIFSADCSQIKQAVSIVHECSNRFGTVLNFWSCMAQRPVLLPDPFDGEKTSWPEWETHFKHVAVVNKWESADEKLKWLRVRLTGKALAAFSRCSEDVRNDYGECMKALAKCFNPDSKREVYVAELHSRNRRKEEDWATYADILKGLADKAYPDLEEAARERLALNQFLGELDKPQVAFGVRQGRPKSLDEAVSLTIQAQSKSTLEANTHRVGVQGLK
eukprot:Em0007g429a